MARPLRLDYPDTFYHVLLHHLGVYRHEEIGRIFGVGYTAITGAVKRGQPYADSDWQAEKAVKEILNDI